MNFQHKQEIVKNLLQKIEYHILSSPLYVPFAPISMVYEKVLVGASAEFPYAIIMHHNNKMYINIENDLFDYDNKKELSQILTFFLLHECSHPLQGDTCRCGDRDQNIYGMAADYVINLFLYNIEIYIKNNNISSRVKTNLDMIKHNFLFDMKYNNMLQEEVYDILLHDNNIKQITKKVKLSDLFNDSGNDKTSNVGNEEVEIVITTMTDKDGKMYKDVSIKSHDTFDRNDNYNDMYKAINTAKHNMIDVGKKHHDMNQHIENMLNTKIDWKKLLDKSVKRSTCKSEIPSWSKVRPCSYTDIRMPILPGFGKKLIHGGVIFVEDESGSVSDNDIAKFVDIILQSKNYFETLYVIKHANKIGWVSKPYNVKKLSQSDKDEILIRRCNGGTSHKEVFEKINELNISDKSISCVVLCTDMRSDINTYINIVNSYIPLIWIVPDSGTYRSYKDKVRDVVIPIN